KAISPITTSSTCGRTGEGPSSAASTVTSIMASPNDMPPLRGDQEQHEPEQCQHLDQHERHPADRHQPALRLRLPGGAVDDRCPDQGHADAWPDRAQAVADHGQTRVEVYPTLLGDDLLRDKQCVAQL